MTILTLLIIPAASSFGVGDSEACPEGIQGVEDTYVRFRPGVSGSRREGSGTGSERWARF